MVIEDYRFPSKEENPINNYHPRLANPLDRLAAVIVDVFIIIFPVASLFMAHFHKLASQYLIMEDLVSFGFYMFLSGLICVFTYLLYTTICTYYWGGSLGKLIFKLKVSSLWKGSRLGFWKIFIREFFKVVGLLGLGLPYISVFTNSHRRTYYDRISETLVLSQHQSRNVSFPHLREKVFFNGLFFAALFMIISIVSVNIYLNYLELKKPVRSLSFYGEAGALCEDVSTFYNELSAKDQKDNSRMDAANSLYLDNLISKDCFQKEILFQTRHGQIDSSYYLGKMLLNSKKEKIVQEYQNKICKNWKKNENLNKNTVAFEEENSLEKETCFMAQFWSLWRSRNWEKLEEWGESLSKNPLKIYSISILIKYNLELGNFDEALSLIEKLPVNEFYKSSIAAYYLKAHWEAGKIREVNFSKKYLAEDLLEEPIEANLSSWMCEQKTWKNCNQFKEEKCLENIEISTFNQKENEVLSLRAIACQIPQPKLLFNKGIRSYNKLRDLFALHKETNTDSDVHLKNNFSKLWAYFNNSQNPYYLRVEAERLYVRTVRVREDLDKYYIFWSMNYPTLNWKRNGFLLFQRYNELNLTQKSLEVGMRLKSYSKSLKEITRGNRTYLSKSSKDYDYHQLTNENKEPEARSPASVSISFGKSSASPELDNSTSISTNIPSESGFDKIVNEFKVEKQLKTNNSSKRDLK